MRAVSSTRLVGLTLLSVVLGLLAGRGPAVDASSRSDVQAGDVVVADQEAGEVLRLSADGDAEVILDDLRAVRSVVVLPDGAVLAADSDAGAVIGTGGRYGDGRVEVATGLEAPEAIARGGGGRLYVSSFSEGTLIQVDLTTGRVEALAAALDGPSAVVALRPPRSRTDIAVAEWFGGAVAVLQSNGDRAATLTRGLERPAGLATDGDGDVYITDRSAGRILAVSAAGRTRVVAEVEAPAGIALDPAEPAAGQSYDLVVATATGIERVDPRTGEADTLSDIETAVGVAVAPDELVVAGEPAATPVAESAGAAGERAAADPTDTKVDPVMVALVAVAVFLAGVAVITGIQLVRGRRQEAEPPAEPDRPSRRERRRARHTERAVDAAERKTAREVAKAERRAAKLAPSEPPVAAEAGTGAGAMAVVAAESGGALVAETAAPSRRERRQADKRARADAKAAEAQAKADAKAAEAQAKKDAKAAAAARAKEDAKTAKADRAQVKADATTAAAQAKEEAKVAKADRAQARADAKDAGKQTPKKRRRDRRGDEAGAAPGRVSGAAAAAAPRTIAPAAVASGPAPTDAGVGPAAAAGAPVAATVDDSSGALPDEVPAGADEPRVPLFAPPAAAPLTAGPFLESLFAGEPPIDPVAVDLPGADPRVAPVALGADPGPTPPLPAVPAVSAVPGGMATGPAALEPAGRRGPGLGVELTEQVSRDVPPPHGLFGRRRAKRRHTEAERRHRRLRALNALVDVPPPALPPAPVRPALGVASAASVAYPVDNKATPALTAPRGDNGSTAGPPATDPVGGVSVPWPGDGSASSGHGSPAWPSEPAR